MITLVPFALCLSASLSFACTQVQPSTKDLTGRARTIFVGTITALRDLSDGNRIATFRLSRVWKGGLSETLEMSMLDLGCDVAVPESVKIGAELLIFAVTTVHGQNRLIEWQRPDSEAGRKRLKELGPGRIPKRD